jgi:hypothetical protein
VCSSSWQSEASEQAEEFERFFKLSSFSLYGAVATRLTAFDPFVMTADSPSCSAPGPVKFVALANDPLMLPGPTFVAST